ncbi:alpha/beta hydrolase-fold protein [[Mycobacterium] nativiensis]|uniref:Alpha/beta hydrolase family protein n=1 Tax=[Mycobacterium] nativiensis TaxID=2855503 RepID=A0ABU5XY95_9MYCO|nr:alpha/beta hydrolase family protein [Mycolicibacter sp. MYC340]MEB3032949.1 alpha/beta hydrolase family protein [Mycolicibacter sp. MYC340]
MLIQSLEGMGDRQARGLSVVLAFVLAACLWNATPARAAGTEYLLVPSAAMGRDIPVAFLAGGPHAAVLLDAFDAGAETSNWLTVGDAMNSLGGKGISVVAPAGGAWSLYTDWEQDGSRQWETFLAHELPDWLAVNRGLAPGGHGIIGAAQGGTGALTIATFHPDRYRYAGSLSGLLTPSKTNVSGAVAAGLSEFGGVDTQRMWGPQQFGRWKWHDPDVHVAMLVANKTRLWVYSPATPVCSNPVAMIGFCDLAHGSNLTFYRHYRAVGGDNGHFDFQEGGNHDWSTWASQLRAMSGDLSASIR